MSILSEMYVATCELFTVGSPKPAVDQYTTTTSYSASCPKSQHNKGQFGKSFDIFHCCCCNTSDVKCKWCKHSCVNKTFNDSSNSHDPRGPPPTPLTLLNVIPTLSYTQVVDLLMAKWVAIFVKTILISREIPAGQLDNARENIDAPSYLQTPVTTLFLWFGPTGTPFILP